MLVFIPSAGTGSRLGQYTKYINKALLPVGKLPVISHIIDFYPTNTDFLIALGYKGDQIKNLIRIMYPKRKINFVNIRNYQGKGSGLSHTIKKSLNKINRDFIFHANDSIIKDKIKLNFKQDTIFISKKYNGSKDYRTVNINRQNEVTKINNKNYKLDNKKLYTYTGICYIKDYKLFKKIINFNDNDFAELNYFKHKLQTDRINSENIVNWFDFGNQIARIETINKISDFNNLNKYDEAIFFKSQKVFKFYTNSETVTKKIYRAKKLNGFVPKIQKSNKYYFQYKYIKGKVLCSKDLNKSNFIKLLNFLKDNFWIKKTLTKEKFKKFKKECNNFYFDKTIKRIDLFFLKTNLKDTKSIINNNQYEKIFTILKKVKWKNISSGVPTNFHGDLHFENIIKKNKTYTFIDWRHAFGKLLDYGDIYYDFAKIYHALIINHDLIRKEYFRIIMKKNNVKYSFKQYPNNEFLINIFENFLKKNGYSVKKTKIITSLIFLNIAPLHDGDYSYLLFFLGKKMLDDIIKDTE